MFKLIILRILAVNATSSICIVMNHYVIRAIFKLVIKNIAFNNVQLFLISLPILISMGITNVSPAVSCIRYGVNCPARRNTIYTDFQKALDQVSHRYLLLKDVSALLGPTWIGFAVTFPVEQRVVFFGVESG